MLKKIISTKIVYDNNWISVVKQKLISTSNHVSEYGIIYHKQSSIITIVKNDNRILIVKVFRHITDKIELELPAGAVEGDETIIDAAKREVLEETNIKISNAKHLLSYHPSNGISNQIIHVILSDYLSGQIKKQVDEIEDAFWINEDELYKLIYNGIISDGPTILAMLLYKYKEMYTKEK